MISAEGRWICILFLEVSLEAREGNHYGAHVVRGASCHGGSEDAVHRPAAKFVEGKFGLLVL